MACDIARAVLEVLTLLAIVVGDSVGLVFTEAP